MSSSILPAQTLGQQSRTTTGPLRRAHLSAIRSSDEYRKGLSDDRRVFYRGAQVPDVAGHPELALAVDHSAICFDIAADRPDLAVIEVDGEAVSTFDVVEHTVARTDLHLTHGRLAPVRNQLRRASVGIRHIRI